MMEESVYEVQRKQEKTRQEIKNQIWDPGNEKIRQIVTIYIYLMFTVFLFYTTDKYFHILKDRYHFFWGLTASTAAVIFGLRIRDFFLCCRNCMDGRLGVRELLKWIWKNSKVMCHKSPARMDICFIMLMGVVVLSKVCSDWPKEAFGGTEGRCQGMFLWLWYAISYYMVSRYHTFCRKDLEVLLASGAVSALWGISDFMGADLLGWTDAIQEGQRGIFVSSFGNINTYTAAMGIFMAIAGTLCICEAEYGEKRFALSKKGYLYGGLFLLFIVAMITGQSDNSLIGLALFFIVLPFYFRGDRGKYLMIFILFSAMAIPLLVVALLKKASCNSYIDMADGILLRLCEENSYLFMAIMAVSAPILLIAFVSCKYEISLQYIEKLRLVILSAGFIGLIMMVWDANHGGHPEFYARFGGWFYFSDSWGSHRWYIWKMALQSFHNFSIWERMIGTGPETFGIIMKQDFYQEMKDASGQIFDSPHNEAIQYLFTTGILGVCAYYGWILSGCQMAYRKIQRTKEQGDVCVSAAVAVIVYVGISLVNISVPITQPFLIVLMGMIASKRNTGTKYHASDSIIFTEKHRNC